MQSPSEHSVNYVYEALYDVHLTYHQGNQVKSIVLPFGFTGGSPVVPKKSDFVIANDAAPVLRRLTASEVEHPLAIYLGDPGVSRSE